MKKLGHIIANFTIKDYAMLLLSLFALMIMSSALCHKHDDDEPHVKEEMREFWDKTSSGQKTAKDQAFGEPMDKLVGAMTTPNSLEDDLNEEGLDPIEHADENTASRNEQDADTFKPQSEAALHNDTLLEEELNAATAVATDDTSSNVVISSDLLMDDMPPEEQVVENVTETNEKALNDALEAVASNEEPVKEAVDERNDAVSEEALIEDLLADIEDEESTPRDTPLSSLMGVLNGEKFGEDDYIEYVYDDNAYDSAADVVAEAAYDAEEEAKYKECIGDDSKVETDEDWLKHLKGKIKVLMLNDEDNECLDILLNEFYIAS